MPGSIAGRNDLTAATHADVAGFYKQQWFKRKAKDTPAGPVKFDAQVMGVALAVYVTNRNLAGTVAGSFGFLVTDTGRICESNLDRRVKLKFLGSKVTTDAGLRAYRELDEAFALTQNGARHVRGQSDRQQPEEADGEKYPHDERQSSVLWVLWAVGARKSWLRGRAKCKKITTRW